MISREEHVTSNCTFAELISVAMADSQDSGLFQRKIILGVDASEHSEQAFDCKYEMR